MTPAAQPHPVLLAAGLGARLGGQPKALHNLRGETLAGRCSEMLAAQGFRELTVVTGHRGGEIEAAWSASAYPLRPRFLHNPRYADLNNFHTVRLACEACPPGRLLILNSDIVFMPELVARACAADADLVLVVDSSDVDEEGLGVRVEDGHVTDLGKHLQSRDVIGEFVGISLLSEAARGAFTSAAERSLRAGEVAYYYEDIYSRICRTLKTAVTMTDPSRWAEIDEPADIPRAEAVARLQDVGGNPVFPE